MGNRKMFWKDREEVIKKKKHNIRKAIMKRKIHNQQIIILNLPHPPLKVTMAFELSCSVLLY